MMDARFWHDRWANNEIGFHKSEANPLLVKYFNELALAKGSRVFVPLCGKTLDIPWLLSNDYRVAGAELSAIAIEQLFAELGTTPAIEKSGGIDHYHANNIDIFVGDIFDVTRTMLGPVDAMYDRAALVALPENLRIQYTAHVAEITDHAPQLLICYEYDQRVTEGPPFSISHEEVRRHYGHRYNVTLLTSTDVPGGLKGKCTATEHVWLLRKA
jgi:thiopurine S-methyltransferase